MTAKQIVEYIKSKGDALRYEGANGKMYLITDNGQRLMEVTSLASLTYQNVLQLAEDNLAAEERQQRISQAEAYFNDLIGNESFSIPADEATEALDNALASKGVDSLQDLEDAYNFSILIAPKIQARIAELEAQ